MFRALLASEHQVLGLVTRPIEAGHRRKGPANPMRDAAEAAGVPVFAPANVNDSEVVTWLRESAADLFVVCDYGQILSAECLGAARLGGINLHGSLLPKYRGAAPVVWAVYNGDTRSGVSVIHMTPRLDAGPILAAIETNIGNDETAEQLEIRLAQLGIDAVRKAIQMLQTWDGRSDLGRPQDARDASRAPRVHKQQALIDWSKPASQLRNQIRAFTPWPGSFTHLSRSNGPTLRLIVHAAEVAGLPGPFDPGSVVEAGPNRLVVACAQDALGLLTVQPAGKRIMAIGEFLRGYPLTPGARFE